MRELTEDEQFLLEHFVSEAVYRVGRGEVEPETAARELLYPLTALADGNGWDDAAVLPFMRLRIEQKAPQ
jgi:hypothetical protein